MTTTRPIGRVEANRQADARDAADRSRDRASSAYKSMQDRHNSERANKKAAFNVRYTGILNKINDHRAQIRNLESQLARLNQEVKVFDTPQKSARSYTYDPNLTYM
jgi:chromosome segregation ATPase